MLKITEEILIDRVKYYDTYIKGKQYFNTDKVREIRTNPKYTYFKGKVHGTSIYEVTAIFNNFGNIVSTSCTCPAHEKYSGDCKHIIALLMKIREYDIIGRFDRKKSEGNFANIINQYRDVSTERII